MDTPNPVTLRIEVDRQSEDYCIVRVTHQDAVTGALIDAWEFPSQTPGEASDVVDGSIGTWWSSQLAISDAERI